MSYVEWAAALAPLVVLIVLAVGVWRLVRSVQSAERAAAEQSRRQHEGFIRMLGEIRDLIRKGLDE